ncbi:hypothetical protein K0M31_013323 [Melipona bicolor]|uniref:Uncharacterized protein n=1 Tax=Melipona bicolor TaxID=60889 RepID=A0AA40KGL6_9HYME|nr:hypothetical protein K0M31_013323 [Melipona bicolor]
MNVSTVFPEGLTETERSQRHATTSIKDDEEAQDRYNRKGKESSALGLVTLERSRLVQPIPQKKNGVANEKELRDSFGKREKLQRVPRHDSRKRERIPEQILKKMPTLTEKLVKAIIT